MTTRSSPICTAIACLALVFTSTVCSAAAATTALAAQATGAISGRVQNVATGQYLNNARVTVKGTESVASPTKPAAIA